MASTLLKILESHEGRGVQGNGAVWRIEGSSSRVEQCKRELLESICRDAQPFVHYEESPMGETGLEGSVEVAPGVWQLALGVSGPALLKWLYLGNWQLYVRAEPLREMSDLCRSTDIEVAAFVTQSEAKVVIDSFHDDVSWVLGVRQ
jgi:hypothetical protein